MIDAFLIQLQFLTRVPVPFNVEYSDRKLALGIIFFPVTGLIIGVLLWFFFLLFQFFSSPLITIIAVITVEIMITGGLHLDGLADTFDGIFSYRPKERILEIMKDSRIGANGVLALIILILTKIALLDSLNFDILSRYLITFPVISRVMVVWAAGTSHYAREDKGFSYSIISQTGFLQVLITTVMGFFICFIFLNLKTLFIYPVTVLAVIFFCRFIKSKIHGLTGDILGAVIELSEVFVLFQLLLLEKLQLELFL